MSTDDLVALVRRWEQETPQAPAIVAGDTVLTYGQLGARSDALAHALATAVRDAGGDQSTVVPLVLDRSPDLFVAMLATWKAGLPYSVIDPTEPPARMSTMLADLTAPVVVTRSDLTPHLPDHPPPVVLVDHDHPPGSDTLEWIGDGSLAYVLYTSGSTGTPKGVMVTRRALANLCAWQRRRLAITPSDRVSQLMSPSFDGSNVEIWPYLSAGASVHLVPEPLRADPAGLIAWLADNAITHTIAPTPVAELLLAQPDVARLPLRFLGAGGDVLRRRPPADARFEMLNLYGPTEATVVATYAVVGPGPSGEPAPVGFPVDGTVVRVLDDSGQPVPAGVTGEIFIGGVGLARGYHRQPALTAASFVPDPFASVPGSRMYRTGDVGFLRPDGALVVTGRRDRQVKIRGMRVELGEIEAALTRHPAVREAAVLAVGTRDRTLVAHVACDPDDAPDEPTLRAHLAERLPAHMVPERIRVHARLPVTDRGKIDRRALAAMADTGPADRPRPSRPPTTLAERHLVDAIGAVLRGRPVDLDRSFTQIGGHSLLAAQVSAQLRERLGLDVPVAWLLDSRPLGELAAELWDVARVDDASWSEPLRPRPDPTAPAPLSHQQEEIWFLDHLTGDDRAYHAQCTVHFSGALRVDLLERALNTVVERHEILRTVFVDTADGPRQVVVPRYRYELPVHDLSGLSGDARDRALERLVQEATAARIDPGRLPLVRWTLVRLAPEEHVLIQVEHHLVHDGWSHAVMWKEIESCYVAWAQGREPSLPPLPVQYADYATWQRHRRGGAGHDRSLRYWVDRLQDLPEPLDLPFARPRPVRQTFHGDARRIEIDRDLYEALRRFSRDRGVSLFTTMYAAFVVLLHLLTGRTDVLVGTAVANRRPPVTAGLVGMLVNLVVLRMAPGPARSFDDLLAEARDVVAAAIAHQDTPFPEVVRHVRPPRDPSRNPITQICFSFHDSPVPELAWPGVTGRIVERSNRTAKFDLNLIVVPRAEQRAGAREAERTDTLAVIWEFNTDLFDEPTVRRMADQYERVLRAVIDAPDRGIGTLATAIATDVAEPRHGTASAAVPADDLVALVRRWEQETPQAPAIVAGDTVLTYGQLGARSDALAHALATAVRDAGGDQSTVVPLVLDRSPDLFVAMLATWKAGLPYSVIDPTEPPARMSTMLADLTAPVVVTRSDLTPHLPDHPPPVVLVDHDHPPGSDTLEWIGDGSLAYVLYTSGSTGTPKGVMVTREAVSSFCGWQRRFLGVSAVDRASQLASPSFDGSNVEYWPYLSAGASVHLVPEPLRADPAGLIAWLADNAITHAFAPTPIAEMLLSDPDVVRLPLRTLMTGGDVLHRRPPHGATFTLLNMYGPTETTIASTYAVVGPGPSGEPAPVGFPVDGTVVRVLDDSGQPVPAGVTGEIFIGGVGLARGYHRQPALTAASFVPDPFASVPGSRMYRTGDVGFLRPDGALVVTGRRDRQVKIRGMRVELGEIEAALLTVDGVVASAARLWRDGDRQTLVGYVVVEPGATLGPDDVRATLGRRLPGHMVPGSVVVLPELPLTDRGKVDYRRLPAPGPRPPRPPDAFPLSDHERLLCQVWADMLGVATVGPHDDFYALGGHSLLAMRISARLRHEHGIDLRVSDILERPTIAELAALIGKQSPRSREGRPS